MSSRLLGLPKAFLMRGHHWLVAFGGLERSADVRGDLVLVGDLLSSKRSRSARISRQSRIASLHLGPSALSASSSPSSRPELPVLLERVQRANVHALRLGCVGQELLPAVGDSVDALPR